MATRTRWQASWERVGVAVAPADEWTRVVEHYREPHRAYHTLGHVHECFVHLDSVGGVAERPGEVELAIWYHDAIYDTHAPDNEERSADWARRAMLASGAAPEGAERVAALVRATKSHDSPGTPDGELLIDVDLAILGAPPERFALYERQIRTEYDWVPEEGFRSGRARVLREFAARDHLYHTEPFRERFERAARGNLERSLRALESPAT